jgi:hypothetical protein
VSTRKAYSLPAVKAGRVRQMIENGEFAAWMLREKRIPKSLRRGLPSDKTIGRRLKVIGLQLSGRER